MLLKKLKLEIKEIIYMLILDVIGLEMIVFNFFAIIAFVAVVVICVPLLIWSIKTMRSNRRKIRKIKEEGK